MRRWNALIDAVMQITPEHGLLPGPREGAIKRALVCLWSIAEPRTRGQFLGRLALPPNYEFMPVRKRFPWLNDSELEDAWTYWPYVLKGLPEEKRGFGLALMRAMRQKRLSEKQITAIKGMYHDYRRWADGGDVEVLDGEDLEVMEKE